jgi:two-component system chemotaxis response regulator CheY
MNPDNTNQKKTKILIVDDDKFLIGMYSIKFESKGFFVDSAVGSLEALKKLRDGNVYDIMLLDIIMPIMNGIELLQTIRAENLSPSSTVIMLTNETQSQQVEEAKNLKADGYIVKASSIPSEVLEEVVKIHSAKNNK